MNNTTPPTYKHNHGTVEHTDVMHAHLLLKQGKSVNEVVDYFQQQGKTEDHAIMIVGYASQIKHKIQKKGENNPISPKTRNKGIAHIVAGSVLFMLGLVFTLANIGYIFYGAIIVGAFQVVRGIMILKQ